MAIDPGGIAPRKDLRYAPGEVLFSVGIYKRVHLRSRSDSRIEISKETKRPPLVKHAVLLMKKAIRFRNGFDVDVENVSEIRHCGLGSSSSLIASVAVAINEAFGNPISSESLIRYLAQNHGEEADGEKNFLNYVQSIGGSAASGLYRAGMIVLAGEAVPIATMKIPSGYEAVIGIPKDFKEQDSQLLMRKELRAIPKFVATGKRYGPANAYNVLHTMLPAMRKNDLISIGDVIYKYRYEMGSIRNCSFTYPKLEPISRALLPLRNKGIAPIVAVSSVGPGVFVISKNPAECCKIFQKEHLRTFVAPICNDGYQVLRRTKVI